MKPVLKIFRIFIASLFLLLNSGIVNAQIWSNPISGSDPGLSNPFTTGDVFSSNISVSGIGKGPGIIGTFGDNRYNARAWDSPSFDADDYFTFTITPTAPNAAFNFSSFEFTAQRSNLTGPINFEIRSSVDGFASAIAGSSIADGSNSVNLTAAAFQNISSPIEFRIYGWGAFGSRGTFSINDFGFNAVLPITLLSQQLVIKNLGIDFKWTTASEENNSHFTVDHSIDGKNFTELGRIEANFERSGNKDYIFSHYSPIRGINYYRLNQFDLDGKKTTFDVLAANFQNKGEKFLFPSQSESNIWLTGIEDGNLKVYDALGRKNMDQKYQVGNAIDVNSLQSGLHFLFINGDTFSFIKQ